MLYTKRYLLLILLQLAVISQVDGNPYFIKEPPSLIYAEINGTVHIDCVIAGTDGVPLWAINGSYYNPLLSLPNGAHYSINGLIINPVTSKWNNTSLYCYMVFFTISLISNTGTIIVNYPVITDSYSMSSTITSLLLPLMVSSQTSSYHAASFSYFLSCTSHKQTIHSTPHPPTNTIFTKSEFLSSVRYSDGTSLSEVSSAKSSSLGSTEFKNILDTSSIYPSTTVLNISSISSVSLYDSVDNSEPYIITQSSFNITTTNTTIDNSSTQETNITVLGVSTIALRQSVRRVQELEMLGNSLSEELKKKSLALSHLRKTNQLLGTRIAELEHRLKVLEISGLWSTPDEKEKGEEQKEEPKINWEEEEEEEDVVESIQASDIVCIALPVATPTEASAMRGFATVAVVCKASLLDYKSKLRN